MSELTEGWERWTNGSLPSVKDTTSEVRELLALVDEAGALKKEFGTKAEARELYTRVYSYIYRYQLPYRIHRRLRTVYIYAGAGL